MTCNHPAFFLPSKVDALVCYGCGEKVYGDELTSEGLVGVDYVRGREDRAREILMSRG